MASNSILAKMAVLISATTAGFNRSLQQSSNQLNNFGKTTASINKTLAAFGVGFGIYEVARGLKSAIGVMVDFEHTMQEVKAITGATGDDFLRLSNDAQRLGSSTKFTATQVGQLQVAYGRLGFTTKEILNATSATLDLAAATGEDLAKSADVAGSTVRGFGLNAVETQRVVDVMASSFNKTALGLENFTESMKYVAPIANAAGASVEETTALLGTLADAGIRGSMAGTSLRKIFTDMSKDGRPLQERLAELAKKGITMSDAMDEVGRTAQTALIVLAKNNDKTNELTSAFKRASGEAAAMARIMQDDLAGDVTKLTSAFEGLILKISDSSVFRKFTQDVTGLLNVIQGNKSAELEDELVSLAKAIQQGYGNSGSSLDGWTNKLAELRKEVGKPIDLKIIEELSAKYGLSSEQANRFYQEVLKANEALSFQEKALKQFDEFVSRNGYSDLTKAVDDYKTSLYKLIVAQEIEKQKLSEINFDGVFDADVKKADEQIASYRRVIRILNEYAEGFTKAETAVQDVQTKTILNLEYYKDALKALNDEYDKTSATDVARLRVLSSQKVALDEIISRLERLRASASFELPLAKIDTGSLVAAGIQMDAIFKRVGKSIEDLRQKTKPITKEIAAGFLDLSGAISSALSGVGDALGQALAGTGNFGENMLKVLLGFARQVGETLISIGVGMLAATKALSNPYTAIAAGVALVALSSALSSSLGSAQQSFNGGGTSAASSATENSRKTGSLSGEGYEIEIGGEVVIDGDKLRYIINRNSQKNSRTRS